MSTYTLQFTKGTAAAEVRVSYTPEDNKVDQVEHRGDATLLEGYFRVIKSPTLPPACYQLTNPATHDALAYTVAARIMGARMRASVALVGEMPKLIVTENDPDKMY